MPLETSIGHIITNGDQRIVEVDDAYIEIVQRERRDLIGRGALSFTYDKDLIRNKPLLDTLAVDGPAFAIAKRYVRGDGSILWVENHVSAIKTGTGSKLLYATCRPTKRPEKVEQLANNYSVICTICHVMMAGRQVFSADIVHNPAAEILVWLYRAEIECSVATLELLAEQIGSSVRSLQRWVALLQERGFVDVENGVDIQASAALRISRRAEHAIDGLLASLS